MRTMGPLVRISHRKDAAELKNYKQIGETQNKETIKIRGYFLTIFFNCYLYGNEFIRSNRSR